MSCHLTVFSSYKCSFTRWNKSMGITVRVLHILWKVREWYLWNWYCFIGMKNRENTLGKPSWMGYHLPALLYQSGCGTGGLICRALSRKVLIDLHFRTGAPPAVTFTCDSHTPCTGVQGASLSYSRKQFPSLFCRLWMQNATCSWKYLTTQFLMPQDRETEEPSARLCLKIKLFIRKIDGKFSPGLFSINHSAEFSLVKLAQFLFVFQLLCSPFWILFRWTIFKYCFERDHNLAEGEIKASG